MSSIQPISSTEPTYYVQPSPAGVPSQSAPLVVPENVFAPPGVFTRLTAALQTYQAKEAPRPEVVAQGQELAKNSDYPSKEVVSGVASELLGDKA